MAHIYMYMKEQFLDVGLLRCFFVFTAVDFALLLLRWGQESFILPYEMPTVSFVI